MISTEAVKLYLKFDIFSVNYILYTYPPVNQKIHDRFGNRKQLVLNTFLFHMPHEISEDLFIYNCKWLK